MPGGVDNAQHLTTEEGLKWLQLSELCNLVFQRIVQTVADHPASDTGYKKGEKNVVSRLYCSS